MVEKMDLDKNGNRKSIPKDADECQFGKSQDATQELEDKTTKEIIHGLRVNQIELKIRNEELKIALEMSRNNYQDLRLHHRLEL